MRLYCIFLLLILIIYSESSKIVSCYYRWNDPSPDLLDLSLCTHFILIGQAYLDPLGHFQQPSDIISSQFSLLKKRKNDIKLMHSLVGSNEAFSTLVSSTSLMSRFAEESKAYMNKYSFDGIDLDWEFPSWSSNALSSDRIRLGFLLKTLRQSYGSSLLISLAVSGPPTISRVAYPVPSLNKYADFVQVMNYDFHVFSYLHPIVGFNAPLRRLKGELGVIGEMNSESSMSTWSSLGLWKNKTVFGIPTYNLAFRLVNYYIHRPYSPSTGTIAAFGSYPKVCNLAVNSSRYFYVWNEQASSPYIWGLDKSWITIEDVRSITAKTVYAKDLQIAGVMIFHIGADDVKGVCGNETYPLLRAINHNI